MAQDEATGGADRIMMERRGAVTLLWLDRAEKINALDPALCAALVAAVETAEADSNIGALVIAGRGMRGFCAGADLATVAELSGAAKRRFIETAWLAQDRLARSFLPSVAALHGHVLGGGLELALACDLRFADPATRFALPELRLGSVPSFGAVQRLPGLIGRARALELLFAPGPISADAALGSGLITGISPPGTVVDAAVERAAELARLPREAVRYLRLALSMPTDSRAAELHGLISDACHASPEYGARIARFAQG